LPKYLDKPCRSLLTYPEHAISVVALREGFIVCAGVAARIATRHTSPQQVRIVPHATHNTMEVIYEADVTSADVDPAWVDGIDLEINNLAAIASNQPGFTPLLVNGRPLKALNQWPNKRRAYYQAKLPEGRHTSHRLDVLTDKRDRQITRYLHIASRRIIDVLVAHRIGVRVIGKNDGWKQDVNHGKRTNQSVVQIPHIRFIVLRQYKAALVGLTVHLTEESHTSTCRFLDDEAVGHHDA
jgi:putative transposase